MDKWFNSIFYILMCIVMTLTVGEILLLLTFFPTNLIVDFYHASKILLISGLINWKFMTEIQIHFIVDFYHANKILMFTGMIHWKFMTEIQIHRPCWEIHIVGIPYHLAKHLQATNSSFIFILILLVLELDSNWNTLQQVRIHT